jgi:hypothetical protein
MRAGMLVELKKVAIAHYQMNSRMRWLVNKQIEIDIVDWGNIGFHDSDECYTDDCEYDSCEHIEWFDSDDFREVLMFKDKGIKKLNLPSWW